MLVLIVGAAVTIPRLEAKVSATNEVATSVQEVPEPDCISVLKDEDACSAAQDVIHKKALQAELASLEEGFASTSAQYEADKAAYLEKKEGLEKEIGSF